MGRLWSFFQSISIILTLLEKLTRAGAISGMVAGALVVIIWIAWIKPLASINEIFGMYEIIPGFIISVIVTYVVSLLTQHPGDFVERDIEKVKSIVRENNNIKQKLRITQLVGVIRSFMLIIINMNLGLFIFFRFTNQSSWCISVFNSNFIAIDIVKIFSSLFCNILGNTNRFSLTIIINR